MYGDGVKCVTCSVSQEQYVFMNPVLCGQRKQNADGVFYCLSVLYKV